MWCEDRYNNDNLATKKKPKWEYWNKLYLSKISMSMNDK